MKIKDNSDEPDKTSYSNKASTSIDFKNISMYLVNAEYNPVFQLEDKFYKITAIKEPLIDNNFYEPGSTIAKFWYWARGNFDKNKVHTFMIPDITQKFTDLIPYNSRAYQIFEMENDVARHKMIVKAIEL